MTRDQKIEEKMKRRAGSGKQTLRAKPKERARQSERSRSSYTGRVSE